ncbi:msx2-interacting protein [Drosophila pseudoobscura]|uniref:Msx2-interacting protein n=1 Tax=Drosophila pseudoobscura pseudoobscura TaxID=46245 RepID=Q2M051_DROPS|nr:msx2-interacting protein [Drosophila pseudoobscura]
MAAVSLSINGEPAVLLQPDTVYRIGRNEAYEFCVADESMELFHAMAIVYRAGVLRVNALMGKVFVNGLENGNVDISRKDAIDGKVKLRFGNVAAEAQIMEPIQHHDSSGFGESLKDTSVDTTSDSLVIPETEVQSVNTSANTTVGSFFVPETQAVVFDKGVSKGGKVSLGDDFMIPETQDLLSTPPVVVHNENSNSIDEDASEMGTQIRICTQEFNNFDEDAFDDFDSSMIMGDSVTALSLRQRIENKNKQDVDKKDLELSALNWSATNPKCTVLNSTNAGELSPRELACITPDLSGQNPSQNAGNCTPDLFDLMNAGNVLSERSATPTLCGLKQLIVATIETPTATPIEVEDKENQDFIVTPSKEPASESPKNGNENNETNQDFIATQPFPFHLKRKQERLQATESLKDRPDGEFINQDFIETQPFPSKLKQNALKAADYPKDRSYEEETNQDFIATQPFPLWKKKNRNAAESTEEHRDSEDNQDFIATEAFPSISKQASKNTPENKENIPVEKNDTEPKASTSKDAKDLNSRTYNEIMEILDKMAAGFPQPPDDPNEPEIKFVKPSIIMDENYNAKVARLESIYPDGDSKRLWGLPKLPEVLNSRKAGSESPPRTTRNACQRRLSDESPRIEPRKRPAAAENSPEPKNKFSRLPLNSFIEEEDKKAADKESTPELVVTNTQLDVASHSKVKKTIGPQKEEQASDMESSPELVVKVRPGRSKRSTSTQHDSASHSKVKKTIGPKEEAQASDKESTPELVVKVRPGKLKRSTNTQFDSASHSKKKKTIEPQKEEPASDMESSPELVVKVRPGRPKKSTSTQLDSASHSKVKKTIGPKEEAQVSHKESSPELMSKVRPGRSKRSTSTQLDSASHSKVKKKIEPKKEEQESDMESSPELVVKVRPGRSKRSTSTQLDSASNSKVKKKIEPKKEEQTADKESSYSKVKKTVEPKQEEQDVPDASRSRLRNAKTIDKIQEKAAKIGNTPEEGVVEKIASKRVGRPRKIKTPTSTPQDTIKSKIKKENPPEKENANTSAVAKRRVGRPRKSQTPTEDKPEIKPKGRRSETSSTTDKMTTRNTSEEKAKGEPQSKAAETRELVVMAKKKQLTKSTSVTEEDNGPTTSTAAAAAQKETLGRRGRSIISTGTGTVASSQENALKAINEHVRKAKGQGKIKIAFSMCNLAELASVLKALKHSVEKTDDPLNCDVLIMDKGDRTYKFLVGIAASKPILSSSWLQSMRASSRATVLTEHLFSDSNFEKLYKFDPLMAMQHPQLLSGLNFMLCDGIQPNQKEMKAIIESAGGKVHKEPPAQELNLYVITVAKDKKRYKRILQNRAHVQYITTEGIMKTLVQHNLDLLNDPKVQI